MPPKKSVENDIVLLQVDKNELKLKIEKRIQLSESICLRQINNQQEKSQMWRDFTDWNTLNEEIIRQAFDKPQNRYVEEYKYKPTFSIEDFYGRAKAKTFQDEVEDDKAAIRYQITKLKRFYEKIDEFRTTEVIQKSTTSKNDINNLILLLNRFHKVAQAIRHRYQNRETIIINDEYDVQDLLNGLLQIYFDDVRKEDFSPSHAGANSRLDFVLKMKK